VQVRVQLTPAADPDNALRPWTQNLIRMVGANGRNYLGHDRISRRPLRCRANIFSGLFGNGQAEQREPQESEPRKGVERFLNSSGMQEKPVFPPYTVIKRTPTYDLRLYSECYPVVEMRYERREEAYGLLGGYIDGDNANGWKFDYSQPVTMSYDTQGGPKTMSMFLSRSTDPEWAKASIRDKLVLLPAPLDSKVSVGIRGGEVLAVRMFDGFITPATANEARRLLLESLHKDGISIDEELADKFSCGQYGAVYQVGGRLNELQLKIKL
jgi:hypothetical protein